ncbi:MAG: UvrD-helicase domain-containing protein [Firmicutes bacterium]|nr:UvrD-helicase domain-containing protein [Bacillota bacterium]
MPQYLDGLNEQQYAAVTAGKGPVLVVAGAGSGKTRVLTNRIAYLMDEMNVPSHQIMAVTFTNKAAKEMQDRLSALLEDASYGLWVGTFHRICLRILRMEGEAIGIDRDFVIYDDADQRSLVKSLLKQQGVEDMVTPAAALRMISDAKNKMYSPEAYEEMAFSTEEEIVARTYKYYEQQKRANNALDFDDLLICTVELFSTCHDVLTEYRERFEYILVDEYQDTNEAQYRLLKMLAGKNGNLFVVGDPDQSIYAFRGAQIENILNYQRDYPGAAVFRLEKNYRSTQQILNVANALISHNGNRLEKNLFTDRVGEQNVEAMLVSDEKDEALFVAENVRRMVNDGKYRYSDMAVFYRTHAQSRVIEEKLQFLRIPYKVFGGQKYYDRKEIKDTLAYLRVILNPNDNVSLLRIINEPRRGIGGTTIEKLEDLSAERSVSIWNILENELEDAGFKTAAKKSLKAFIDIIRHLRIYALTHNVTEITAEMWQSSGYRAALEKENSIENLSRLENMEEFLTVTSDYDKSSRFSEEEHAGTLGDFLASISLSSELDQLTEEDDYVTLMTIHMAKGLEFPVVFLVGMEESVFPHIRSVLSGSEAEIEEERRLCYVGVTRAMDVLKIIRAYRRTLWGKTSYNKPSRFLDEMNIRIPEKKSAEKPKREIQPNEDVDEYCLGDKVRHCKFGEGVIVFVDNVGGKAKVAFPDLGIKEFLLAYANLEKI